MKKILLIIMMVVIANIILALDASVFVENYNEFLKEDVVYDSFKIQSRSVLETAKEYMVKDYLTGDVQLSKLLWDNIDKEAKEILILSLVVDMYEKTKSTDIRIKVNHTTVFWCISGMMLEDRVY